MSSYPLKVCLRITLIAVAAIAVACGGGGGGGGGGSPPPPPVPPTITGPASPLADGSTFIAYGPVTFTATGDPTITWSVTAGSLPPGITLTAAGVYSGTPTTVGTYSFTVTATNGAGASSLAYTHTIVQGPIIPTVESEPNDSTAAATPLGPNGAGSGSLSSFTDVDYYSFTGTAGDVVKVEQFASRLDLSAWDTALNLPKISVLDSAGGYLIGHDFANAGTVGWAWGAPDMDIPMYSLPTTGTYYVLISAVFTTVPPAASPAGGPYAFRVSSLGLTGVQSESEPNDTFGTADSITPGTIKGFRTDGEVGDYYSFTISAPTIVYFEIHGYRNGVFGVAGAADDDYFDPEITLYGTDGVTPLATNDDVFYYDSAIQYVITTSGTYYLDVHESPFGTDGDSDYFITFTSTPLGTTAEVESNDSTATATSISYGTIIATATDATSADYYSFSATAGDMVRVFYYDLGSLEGATGDITVTIEDSTGTSIGTTVVEGPFSMNVARAIIPTTGTYYVHVLAGSGTTYAFRIERLMGAGAIESELNDTTATANTIPTTGPDARRVTGVIATAGDLDVYSFSAAAGELVTFAIYGGSPYDATFGIGSGGFINHDVHGSLLQPTLTIYDSTPTVIKSGPFIGPTSIIVTECVTNGLAQRGVSFIAPTTGTYFIEVSSYDGTGGTTWKYVLERR